MSFLSQEAPSVAPIPGEPFVPAVYGPAAGPGVVPSGVPPVRPGVPQVPRPSGIPIASGWSSSYYGSGAATAAASVQSKIRSAIETITERAAHPSQPVQVGVTTVVVDEGALRRLAEAQERIHELSMQLQRERRSKEIEDDEARRLAAMERGMGQFNASYGAQVAKRLIATGVPAAQAARIAAKAYYRLLIGAP